MLISTGKLYTGDAYYAIEQMLKTGQIVEVEFHRYKRDMMTSKYNSKKIDKLSYLIFCLRCVQALLSCELISLSLSLTSFTFVY
jgi:hypothetical protein